MTLVPIVLRPMSELANSSCARGRVYAIDTEWTWWLIERHDAIREARRFIGWVARRDVSALVRQPPNILAPMNARRVDQ